MSWTDTERDAALAAFFRTHLVPIAEQLRARKCSFFAVAPERVGTYYRTRDTARDYIVELRPEAMAEQLRALWHDVPELLPLVEPLLALRDDMARDEPADAAADVSPFVYAMF